MREVEFVPVILNENIEIFSIRICGKELSETNEFIINFKDSEDRYLKDDYNAIISTIKQISSHGVLESQFRPEGKLSDRLYALPLFTIPRNHKKHGTLRLYCIRISEKILILGSGGIKGTKTYNEDPHLLEKVKTLQNIDKELYRLEDENPNLSLDLLNLKIYID